ncbi:MAG: pyridoxal phosphate-dependent aminotransferase [Sakamotonia sp.]|jgi:threonine-phosphate decarboxylase
MEHAGQWEKAYTHGGDVYRNTKVRMDFSININPLGMPDFIKQAAMNGVEESARYPDSRCGRLRSLAAGFYGVPEEVLVFGNGAAELIFGIVRAASPRRAVLTAPSFTEYEAALSSAGAEILFFPLKEEEGFSLPGDRYLDFLKRSEPDLIFLCNPANPSGRLTPGGEIRRILEFCGSHGILAVIDECFLELAEEDEKNSVLDLVRAGERHIFLLKAFTKSFAMAGLRLGYGFLADGELRLKLQSQFQPWNVSIPAQEAGCAAFGAEREAYLGEARKLIRQEREYLSGGLRKLGFDVFPSEANFLLFKRPGEADGGELYPSLLSRGILIRRCGDYRGLTGEHYRICVKKREENSVLLENLGEIYKKE